MHAVRALPLPRSLPAMREFFGPLPLLAVGLLALNDQVLKARFPGLITGKLSDLAGCFFLPLFTSALLSLVVRWPLRTRLAVGLAATLLLFCAIKLSPAAADAVAAALSTVGRPLGLRPSRIVADPTDLLAVPLAFLAVRYGRRRGEEPA